MKIGVLTSSRADYGIYRPLLLELRDNPEFDLTIIAFGGHLEERLGNTIDLIKKEFNQIIETSRTMESIANPMEMGVSMGSTTIEISKVMNENSFDLVFCLGDRYEMFSAVSALNPYQVPIAHIHGGETTLGAIDNKYRHAISHLSDLHFTTCAEHADRVRELVQEENVHNVGSLSLHNIGTINTLSKEEIKDQHGVDLNEPTALVTFHPVTNELEKTQEHITELLNALSEIPYNIVFTGVNADPESEKIREKLKEYVSQNEKTWYFENLGSELYFAFMKNVSMMIGNTSSGVIEAALFNTPVVNVGNRQLGRYASKNVIHSPTVAGDIINAVGKAAELKGQEFVNIYYQEDSVSKIINALKEYKKEGLK